MNPLAPHFLTMAYNNGWSNYRLYQACRQLSQQDFIATRVGFFPSIKGTLNHNLTVDWYYVDALERGLQGTGVNMQAREFFRPQEPFDRCADLWREQRAVQAHGMLSGTPVPPPQLDEFFCEGDGRTGDYALRQPDFRELRWTEEEIWGK